MKAILEFTLPEEAAEHMQAVRAGDVMAALWEFDQYLRSQERHLEPEQRDDIVGARRTWLETMGEFLP